MKVSVVFFNEDYVDEMVHKIMEVDNIEVEYRSVITELLKESGYAEEGVDSFANYMPDNYQDAIMWLRDSYFTLDIVEIPERNTIPGMVTPSNWSVTYK